MSVGALSVVPSQYDPVRVGAAGRVELWPPVEPDEPVPPPPWDPPVAAGGQLPARTRLANEIARKIHRWTRDPEGEADRSSV